jgi:mono/diheme cytochrome c family protein
VKIGWSVLLPVGLVLATACGASAQPRAAGAALVARGRYLVTIMDCAGCHTPGALAGQPDASRRLAGSDVGFGGPDGVVYPRNLTPDRETGLGGWSDAEIIRAIRQGRSRDGRPLAPVMPWPSYAALTPEDTKAVVAYLRSIPPVRFAVPANVKSGERVTAPYLSVVSP